MYFIQIRQIPVTSFYNGVHGCHFSPHLVSC